MTGQLNNYYNPNATLTRAETATALYRFYCVTTLFRSGTIEPPVPSYTQAAINTGNAEHGAMSETDYYYHLYRLTANKLAAKSCANAFSSSIDVASTYLNYFLDIITYSPTSYPVKRMLESGNKTEPQYAELKNDLDNLMVAAECYGTTSQSKTFSQRQEDSFGLSSSGKNWYLSLGTYRYFTNVSVRQTSANTYSATVTYKIKDYYDWDKNSDYDLGGVTANILWELNYAGIAKNYSHSGTATITINWTSGARFSNGSNITISIA